MGIFTSSKRRAEQAAQSRLTRAQLNVDRLRVFIAIIAAGLESEGYRHAQRAIGVLVAVAGWPSLVNFIYWLGSFEHDVARITNEDEGLRADRAICSYATHMLWKVYAQPITLADVDDMQTIACILMVWWGFSDIAEPHHPVAQLMRHFGGHPFKTDIVEAVGHRFGQIRSRITPAADKMWEQAERAMSVYGSELPAA